MTVLTLNSTSDEFEFMNELSRIYDNRVIGDISIMCVVYEQVISLFMDEMLVAELTVICRSEWGKFMLSSGWPISNKLDDSAYMEEFTKFWNKWADVDYSHTLKNGYIYVAT